MPRFSSSRDNPRSLSEESRGSSRQGGNYGSEEFVPPRETRPLGEHKSVSVLLALGAVSGERGLSAKEWFLKAQSSLRRNSLRGKNGGLVCHLPSSPDKENKDPRIAGKNFQTSIMPKVDGDECEKRKEGIPPLTSTFSPQLSARSSRSPSSQGCKPGHVVAPDGVTMVKDRRKRKPRGTLTVRREIFSGSSDREEEVTEMQGPTIATVEWVDKAWNNAVSHHQSHIDGLNLSCSMFKSKSETSHRRSLTQKVCLNQTDDDDEMETMSNESESLEILQKLVSRLKESNDNRDSGEGQAYEMTHANESCYQTAQNTSTEDPVGASSSLTWHDTKGCRVSSDALFGVTNSQCQIGQDTPYSPHNATSCWLSTPLACRVEATDSSTTSCLTMADEDDYTSFESSESVKLQSHGLPVLGSGMDTSMSSSSDGQQQTHLGSIHKHVVLSDRNFHNSHSLALRKFSDIQLGEMGQRWQWESNNLRWSPGVVDGERSYDNSLDMIPQISRRLEASFLTKKKVEACQGDPENEAKDREMFSSSPSCTSSLESLGDDRPGNADAPLGSFVDLAHTQNVHTTKHSPYEGFEIRPRSEFSQRLHDDEVQFSSQVLLAETLYELAAANLLRTRSAARRLNSLEENSCLKDPSSLTAIKLTVSKRDPSGSNELRLEETTLSQLSSRVSQQITSGPDQTELDLAQPCRTLIQGTRGVRQAICAPGGHEGEFQFVKALQASVRDVHVESHDANYSSLALSHQKAQREGRQEVSSDHCANAQFLRKPTRPHGFSPASKHVVGCKSFLTVVVTIGVMLTSLAMGGFVFCRDHSHRNSHKTTNELGQYMIPT